MGRKSKLGILGASLLAGSLALGKEAYAQQNPRRDSVVSLPRQYIYSTKDNLTTAGNGTFLTNYVNNVDLSPSSSFSLKDLNTSSQPISYYFVKNPRRTIEEIAENRRSEDLKTGIGRSFQDYIRNLARTIKPNDPQSIEVLNNAIRDGVISPGDSIYSNGRPRIREGIYLAMVKTRTESYPVILNVRLKAPEERAVPPVIRTRTDTLYRDRTVTDTLRVPVEVEGGPSSRLFADVFGGENGMIGGELGIGYGPFGLSVNYSAAEDEIVESRTVPLSNGRVGAGIEEEKDFKSLGISAELHQGPFFAGVGANKGFFTTVVNENILSAIGDTLAHEVNPRSDNRLSYRFFGGAEIPVKDRLGLRALVGHDTQKGLYGGVGISLRLNRKQHR